MSGGRYWVKRLDELPLVPTDDPDDFDWYPVQHHLGLGAFGVNGFGGDAGTTLVAEHDESDSAQEELYVVVEGTVRFMLGGETFQASAVSFVAVPDPAVVVVLMSFAMRAAENDTKARACWSVSPPGS